MECSEWLSLILFGPAVIAHDMVITLVFMLSLADQRGRGWGEDTSSRKSINFIAKQMEQNWLFYVEVP